jgi:methionine synthase / methylenetetrahydrofolate reductase(NADPH)
MRRDAYRSLLSEGPLLADGGMGTSLIARGVAVDACMEELNVRAPARVVEIHTGFVGAGARLVLTNTFGANRYRLERFGLADRVAELCRAGVALARDAGAELVAGSMGPLGVRLQPYGRVRPEDAVDAYLEQALALMEAGADLLVIETQTDLREMEQAVAAAREVVPDVPVVATATFTRDDRTLLGSTPEEVASTLVGLRVDAIGVNCGEGPAQVLRVVRAMRPVAASADAPLVARPNAGGPTEIAGRFVYPATPEYFGEIAHALLDEGVAVVGGCCGTGPAHTAAIAAAIRDRGPRARIELPDDDHGERILDVVTVTPPTKLEAKLATAHFVVTVEMEPPRSFNAARLVAAAETLRDAGADAIDVADSPMAKMRMSAWAACRLIHEQADVETVLHFPTRGRNLLRLQGDLLGAHALGIRNLFVCVGDPVTIGDYPHGSDNVDVTATGLLSMITDAFNAGVDRSGTSIGAPTAFFPGAAVAPNAPDLDHEVRLLARKVKAGARFVLTQPVYAVEPLVTLREAYEKLTDEPFTIPLLAGVLPLVSSRHAGFLHNEVPGIDIPEPVRDRMARAGDDAETAWAEGRAMALELVASLRATDVAGVYLMPQFGRYDRAAEVVEAARGPATM